MISAVYENFDLGEMRSLTPGEIANSLDKSRIEGYAEGFEKGYAQGTDDALTERDLSMLKVTQALETQIQEILNQTTNCVQTLDDKIQKSVLVLFEALLPAYIQNHGKNELLSFVQKTLQDVLKKEDLCVYVHPSMVDAIVLESEIQLLGKESLAPYECDIKWNGGGANFSLENLSQTITNLLKGTNNE